MTRNAHLRARLVRRTLLTAIVFALAATGTAAAVVSPTVTTSLSDTRLGAHSDLSLLMNFDYGGTHPGQYPVSPWQESVADQVIDIPAGMVGNPNAIPIAERCDPAVSRPQSARVQATSARSRCR